MLNDNDLFPYGKYKKEGRTMDQVPAWYLLGQRDYFSDKEITKDSAVDMMINYVNDNEEVLQKQYEEGLTKKD